jgi:hypothetical protein
VGDKLEARCPEIELTPPRSVCVSDAYGPLDNECVRLSVLEARHKVQPGIVEGHGDLESARAQNLRNTPSVVDAAGAAMLFGMEPQDRIAFRDFNPLDKNERKSSTLKP